MGFFPERQGACGLKRGCRQVLVAFACQTTLLLFKVVSGVLKKFAIGNTSRLLKRPFQNLSQGSGAALYVALFESAITKYVL